MSTMTRTVIVAALTAASCFGNPIFDGWYADPQIRRYGDTYWVFPTRSDRFEVQTAFDAFSSKDLKTWTKHANILTTNEVKWARGAMWAPDAHEIDGKYYFFDKDGVMEKYKDLQAVNKEFVGWLRIKDTGVDVPVVQTGDNETYLRKDFYGNYSVYGNPFLDCRNNLKSLFEKGTDVLAPDRNTTIYGHNMLDNMVFAELLGYRDVDFYKAHPIIEFNTIYGESKWKIVSAFLVNSTDDLDNGYSLPYNFVTCYDDNYAAYIKELQKRSYINTGVDVKGSDVLLTLSTCDKSEIEEGRFVVVARMLRAGESEDINAAAVSENTNIKFPQGYYDKKNLNNPYRDDAQWDPYAN